METSSTHWLPLTEYALRSGMSISTLRRKIKSSSIEFKMEDGRYLIKSDDLSEAAPVMGFTSSDQTPQLPAARPGISAMPPAPPLSIITPPAPPPVTARTEMQNVARPALAVSSAALPTEVAQLREEFRRMQEDNFLRWRALEARVAGIAKKLEMFSEQIAEAKMLVKIFEEKLDHRA